MAEKIMTEDKRFLEVYAAWLREGRPYKLLHNGQAYVSYEDNGDLFFITVDRDDPHWLDPSDPTNRWHGAYGYTPKGE